MTPNPNPSPELLRHGWTRVGPSHFKCVLCDELVEAPGGNPDLWGCDKTTRAPSPQTLPAPGEVEEVARIVKWINEAIERTKKHGATEGVWLFGSQWSVVRSILATVAAANDEGVAQAAVDTSEYRTDYQIGKADGFEAAAKVAERWMSSAKSCAPAIRLLSQGGGKA